MNKSIQDNKTKKMKPHDYVMYDIIIGRSFFKTEI